jgi:uncharacterized pyridoxamine 5'-phosphate oxidase family protein
MRLMFESPEQVDELRALINLSFAAAGSHLLFIMTPERRLSVEQTLTYLQGIKHLALATASLRGVPRVSPVDAHFLWGHFYFSTDGRSLRARQMRSNPQISATHFVGDDIAITVHGRPVFLERDSEEERSVHEHLVKTYGMSPYEMTDDVVIVRIEAHSFFPYAFHAENYPA